MRNILIYLSLLLGLSFFTACKKEGVTPDGAASGSAKTAPQTERPLQKGDRSETMTGGVTLAQIDSDPFTHLTSPSSTYALQMQGVWNYSAAYLLIHTATGKLLAEVYHFSDPTAYVTAGGNCTQEYKSQPATGDTGASECCEGTGTGCSWGTTANGGAVIIRCN